MAKSKLRENNEPTKEEKEEQRIKEIKLKIHDFMPRYTKEEHCFKDAVFYDFGTKKISEDGWPRFKPVAQTAHENFLKEWKGVRS